MMTSAARAMSGAGRGQGQGQGQGQGRGRSQTNIIATSKGLRRLSAGPLPPAADRPPQTFDEAALARARRPAERGAARLWSAESSTDTTMWEAVRRAAGYEADAPPADGTASREGAVSPLALLLLLHYAHELAAAREAAAAHNLGLLVAEVAAAEAVLRAASAETAALRARVAVAARNL